VVIVGDDPAELQKVIAERLDGWQLEAIRRGHDPYPDPAIGPVSEDFEIPDKENAFFMAGMPIKMNERHAIFRRSSWAIHTRPGPGSRLFAGFATAKA
jgi:hypothetical protein